MMPIIRRRAVSSSILGPKRRRGQPEAPGTATEGTSRFLLGMLRPYWKRLLGGAGILLLTTAAMLALPQFLKRMFDAALQNGDRAELAWLALGMMGVVVLLVAGVLVRAQLIQVTAMRAVSDLRNRLIAHLLRLDVSFYDRELSGELMSRVTSDTATLREFVQVSVPMLVRGLLLGTGALAALVLTNATLASILLVAVVPLVVVAAVRGQKIKKLARRQADAMAALKGLLGEMIGNIRTVLAFDQQAAFAERGARRVDDLLDGAKKQIVATAMMVAVNVVIGFAALVGVVWLGGLQVMDGTFSIGGMMAFLLYLGFLADATSNLGNFWPSWQNTLGSLDRLVGLLREEARIVTPAKPVALLPARGGRTVMLEGVNYAYPSRPDTPVLKGLSLRVDAGTQVALVGPSGSGKSSIFRLLQRLDDVQQGAVTLDGVDVRELELGELRRQFALVAQDSPLFSGTVRENVAFARTDADDDMIWAALGVANAASFVQDLPKGLDTRVGERGVQLSGGQRQRIAIARAVLVDAPVLLLDEATSHLDTESEKLVQEALARAGKGRTVMTIAHRLSTVAAADHIYVLQQGKVVASGRHAELLAGNDLYRALAAVQLEA